MVIHIKLSDSITKFVIIVSAVSVYSIISGEAKVTVIAFPAICPAVKIQLIENSFCILRYREIVLAITSKECVDFADITNIAE